VDADEQRHLQSGGKRKRAGVQFFGTNLGRADKKIREKQVKKLVQFAQTKAGGEQRLREGFDTEFSVFGESSLENNRENKQMDWRKTPRVENSQTRGTKIRTKN
jgi:hypothetical protein